VDMRILTAISCAGFVLPSKTRRTSVQLSEICLVKFKVPTQTLLGTQIVNLGLITLMFIVVKNLLGVQYYG
jgi:hypothetical protein